MPQVNEFPWASISLFWIMLFFLFTTFFSLWSSLSVFSKWEDLKINSFSLIS